MSEQVPKKPPVAPKGILKRTTMGRRESDAPSKYSIKTSSENKTAPSASLVNKNGVDEAFDEYLSSILVLAAKGKHDQCLENLQQLREERIETYPKNDLGILKSSLAMADVALQAASVYFGQKELEKAHSYLMLARSKTENIASDWEKDAELNTMQKRISKEQAKYYQMKGDWYMAYECLKITLSKMKQLKENTTEIHNNCAFTLKEMGKWLECFHHAELGIKQVEKELKIDPRRPLQEYRFTKKDRESQNQHETLMTNYAVGNHTMGKALHKMDRPKVARQFLQRAQYVATSILHKKKPELLSRINADLNEVTKVLKSLPATAEKEGLEDIEKALLHIKTDIANQALTQPDDVERDRKRAIKTEELQEFQKKKQQEAKAQDPDADDDPSVSALAKKLIAEQKEKEEAILEMAKKKNLNTFDLKQDEFQQKQMKELKRTESLPRIKEDKKPLLTNQSVSSKDDDRLKSLSRAKGTKSVQKLSQAEQDARLEQMRRVKKPVLNPAREGALSDPRDLNISKDDADREFFYKRQAATEKTNADLGLNTDFQDNVATAGKLPAVSALGELQSIQQKQSKVGESYTRKSKDGERSLNRSLDDPTKKLINQRMSESYSKDVASKLEQDDRRKESKRGGVKNDQARALLLQPEKLSDDDEVLGTDVNALGKELLQKQDQKPKNPLLEETESKHGETFNPFKTREELAQELKKPSTGNETTIQIGTLDSGKKTEKPVAENKQASNQVSQPGGTEAASSSNASGKKILKGEKAAKLGMSTQGSPRNLDQSNENAAKRKSQLDTSLFSSQHATPLNKKTKESKTGKQPNSAWKPPTQKRRQQRSKAREEEPAEEKEVREAGSWNKGRLAQLSNPKPAYVLYKDEDDGEDEDDTGLDLRNKEVKLDQYVQREVPPIRNHTGGPDSNSNSRLSSKRGSKLNFDTSAPDSQGIFANMGKKGGGDSRKRQANTSVVQLKDKKVKRGGGAGSNFSQAMADQGLFGSRPENDENDDEYMPSFMKKAQKKNFSGLNETSVMEATPQKAGGASRASKQSHQTKTQKFGKTPAPRPGKPNAKGSLAPPTGQLPRQVVRRGLTPKELYKIQEEATRFIQKMARGWRTRHWYFEYKVRKRLGVPFSGLEFIDKPFLKQFNVANFKLQEAALVTPQAQVVNQQQEAVSAQPIQQVRHGLRQAFGLPSLNQKDQPEEERKKSPGKRIPKGTTTQELVMSLQNDFINKGPRAYQEFKAQGIGIDYDQEGNLVEKKGPLELDDLGMPKRKLPALRETAEVRFFDYQEPEEYLIKKGRFVQKQKQEVKEEPKPVIPIMESNGMSQAMFAAMHNNFGEEPANLSQTSGMKENEDLGDALMRRGGEDANYFPIERYKEFSREPIVFCKKMASRYVKWMIKVGTAYIQDQTFFVPVKILGEPLNQGNLIVSYEINLELLKISKEIEGNFQFETIWPFILYLFNNWVRHQAKLLRGNESEEGKTGRELEEQNDVFAATTKNNQAGDDALNFSSEVEFDDRFDLDLYDRETGGGVRKLLNRNVPIDSHNQQTGAILKEQRKKLFEAYHAKLQMNKDKDLEDPNEATGKKRVRVYDQELGVPVETRLQNPFDRFLEENFVKLPEYDPGQMKLLQNMQKNSYFEYKKLGGLANDVINMLNEERRKIRSLPALTLVDYNCIDRAASKLKTILDCLFFERQQNGLVLVPRNVKDSLKAKEWFLRRKAFQKDAAKFSNISLDLLKQFGVHVQYKNQFNSKAIQFQESQKKIDSFNRMQQFNATNSPLDVSKPNKQSKFHININNIDGHEEEEEEYNEVEPDYRDKLQVADLIEEKNFETDLDRHRKEMDIEDFFKDGDILEQGVVTVEDHQYIMTMKLKKIVSNTENIRELLQHNDLLRDFEMGQENEIPSNFKANHDGEQRLKKLKNKRLCEFISLHPQVKEYDSQFQDQMDLAEQMDQEQENFRRDKTLFKSYLELSVTAHNTSTFWDGWINVRFEQIVSFFAKFQREFKVNDFLKRGRFSTENRFLFYNYFSRSLFMEDCKIQIDLNRIDGQQIIFDDCFLRLEERTRVKQEHNIFFYYDDLLDKSYDATRLDNLTFPFYQPIKEAKYHLNQFDEEAFREAKMEREPGIRKHFVKGQKKPLLLVDDDAINDPANVLNLTLSGMPDTAIFTGRVHLSKSMAQSSLGTKEAYNLKIDYYSRGSQPILEVKAYKGMEVFTLKIFDQKQIKDICRICQWSDPKMERNQLQSAFSIQSKINGRYLQANFMSRVKNRLSEKQNYINMLICNDNQLRTVISEKSFHQFQGVVYFQKMQGRSLVTVTEFKLDLELIDSADNSQFAMIYGNKHISKKRQDRNDLDFIPQTKFKEVDRSYRIVKFWKVNMFNIFNKKHYDSVISYDDLVGYYESDMFKFYSDNIKAMKPNLVMLLKDYIDKLFVYRTPLGSVLFWHLPRFKKKKDGMSKPAENAESIYDQNLIGVYQKLQKKVESQRKDDDTNSLPFSLDKGKTEQRIPKLSLRCRLAIEKELPIHKKEDLKVLKLTCTEHQIVIQRSKKFKLIPGQFCFITVTYYQSMECWYWSLYFPKTCRTFSVTFFVSDIQNMQTNLAKQKKKADAYFLFQHLIDISELEVNRSGDIKLCIDHYKEPLKEILFQDYIYSENAEDIFFMQIIVRSLDQFVTEIQSPFPTLDVSKDLNDFNIILKAYSVTRCVWVKYEQSLPEVVQILKQAGFMTEKVKLIYQSMLKQAAVLIAYKQGFSDEAKTATREELSPKRKEKAEIELEAAQKYAVDISQTIYQASISKGGMTFLPQLIDTQIGTDEQEEFKRRIGPKVPNQVVSIIYNAERQEFTYKLYRGSDGTTQKTRLAAEEVKKTCVPYYQIMMEKRMHFQVGERIAKYYLSDVLAKAIMKELHLEANEA